MKLDRESGAHPATQDPATQASPEAATASSPSGECPLREGFPDVLDGHWGTPDGRMMAEQYLGKSRAELCHGDLTDFHLANRQYLANRDDLDLLGWQTAAKERIRWLSAQLAKAALAKAVTA